MLAPALAFTLTLAVYPVIASFILSLYRIILSMPALGEPFVGLENYVLLFADPAARQAFIVTAGFVVCSTMFEVAFGLGIALVIHAQFPGRGWVRAAALIPWVIPTAVASQMWRYMFNDQYGLANLILFGDRVGEYVPWLASPGLAFSIMVLVDVWKTSSFAALLILAGLQLIPDELLRQAARIDGAGLWQRFWHITLPLLKPALLLALLFRTMDAFRRLRPGFRHDTGRSGRCDSSVAALRIQSDVYRRSDGVWKCRLSHGVRYDFRPLALLCSDRRFTPDGTGDVMTQRLLLALGI